MARIKSDFIGCKGSVGRGFRIFEYSDDLTGKLELDEDSVSLGLRREYSQMLLAPQLKRLWTIVSCSGTHKAPEPGLAHLICDTCPDDERKTITSFDF